MSSSLNTILDYLGDHVKGKGFSLKLNSNVFFDIIGKQNEKFQHFQNQIKSDWENFKLQNQNRILKKTYTTFFYLNFQEYFKYFISNFCGFNEEYLDLVIKEKVSDKNLFVEYNYLLSEEEEKDFIAFSKKLQDNLNGITTPSGYLYLIVTIFGVILRKLLQEEFYVILDAIIIKNSEKSNKLNFLIVIKNSKDDIFENYYYMFLYYFLRHFKGVPDDYFKKLLNGREKLYKTALDEYPSAKEHLVDLLYYFFKKCNLLQNFSPILDFLNFVCSRVEDSIFSKFDIIKKEFLDNFNYSEEKKNAFIRIFDFLDKKSTLYSTFQANNLPSPKAQFNLFLLYTKYYFGSGSLEAFEVGDLLFLPSKFKAKLDQTNKQLKNQINASTIKQLQNFLNEFSIISNLSNPNLIFEKIFNKSVSQINYDFFKTFLRSLNLSLTIFIDRENKILTESPERSPLTFNIIIDHICRMLYTLIDKIFIRADPSHASNNFIDPRSRYVGKNIALRVLELFIFQDLNVSDDVWPDYIISMNRENLIKDLKSFSIDIPEKNFYGFEDIARFVITYNFQSYTDKLLFEQWLIDELIIPLNEFIIKVRSLIKDPKDKKEIYDKLTNFLLDGAKLDDKDLQKSFKFVCEQLATFWEKS
ncbi:MAG: hypothetical protein ACFE85_08660 [Candidatus Hodarchaeota archaeon]